MSIEEKLELQRIIISSNLSDEDVKRVDELINLAIDEAKQEERERVYAAMSAICDDGK